MNTRLFAVLLVPGLLFGVAIAEETPLVVTAEAATTTATPIRIRSRDVQGWKSESDRQLLITTKRRDHFLVELTKPCYPLRGRANDGILYTRWSDEMIGPNDAIRIIPQDRYRTLILNRQNLGNFDMELSAIADTCRVASITALGKAVPSKKAKSAD